MKKVKPLNIASYDSYYEDYRKIEALRMHCDYEMLPAINQLIDEVEALKKQEKRLQDLEGLVAGMKRSLEGRLKTAIFPLPLSEPADNKPE